MPRRLARPADYFILHGQRAGLTAIVAGLRRTGEPMLARDRHQDRQWDGQGENIMPPMQAVEGINSLECRRNYIAPLLICHIHRQFSRKGTGMWIWLLLAPYLH